MVYQEAIERLQGSRILLVEDSLLNHHQVFALLKINGLDVDLAKNGEQAKK